MKVDQAARAMKVYNYWKAQHPDAPDSENPIVANGLYPDHVKDPGCSPLDWSDVDRLTLVQSR